MYEKLVKLINYLIKIANSIRLSRCAEQGLCLCKHCSNGDCKYRDRIRTLID